MTPTSRNPNPIPGATSTGKLITILAAGIIASGMIAQERTQIFYVSTQGNDSWSGTLAAPLPGQTNGPFLTVPAALEAARSALQDADTSVGIEVRTGTYRLDQPIKLNSNHSGTPGKPFTISGHRDERPTLELQKAGNAVIEVGAAHDVVLSSLILTGKAETGVALTGSRTISLHRLDLSSLTQGVGLESSDSISIAGCRFADSEYNRTLLDTIRPPSTASNNLTVTADFVDIAENDPLLILAQRQGTSNISTSVLHPEGSLRDGLIAHYAFGPENRRTDRVSHQNLQVRGEPGVEGPGIIGDGLHLKINSIQYAPIGWNGSDLPRAANFWYWNGEGVERRTYLLTTADMLEKPGFTLVAEKRTVVLSHGSSKRVWTVPDFRNNPSMLTLVIPHRSARLSEILLYLNAEPVPGSVEGDDVVFDTSSEPPHLASTDEKVNLSGQKHHFDELSFWNRGLEQEEITALYNSGEGVELLPPPQTARGGFYQPRSWDWPWQVDTTAHRETLAELWESLKALDIGNGVPTLDQRHFQGTPEKTIHVNSTSGNDFFGSGSSSRPFKTLHRAVESLPLDSSKRLTRSTVIELAPGIHQLDRSLDLEAWGSPEKWLAIRGSGPSDQRPIVTFSDEPVKKAVSEIESGGKGGGEELIKVQGQYIEFSGLVLDQRRDDFPEGDRLHKGVFRFFSHRFQPATNGIGCRILDLEIRNFLHAGIHGDAKGLIIDGVYIHDGGNTRHDHGIYIAAYGDDSAFELRRSIVLNSTGAGTSQHASSDGRDLPAPEGGTITHNVIMGSRFFGVTTAGSAGRIAHNVIGYTNWFGVHFYRSSASLTHIQNNIFYGYPETELREVPWTSYLLSVAKTKEPVGVVVEGNYFETGPATKRRGEPGIPSPWVSGNTYFTSNTVERDGAFYICEIIDNSDSISKTGPSGTDPNRPSIDGDNIRWWFLTTEGNRVENNLLNADNTGDANFVDATLGDFRLKKNGQAVGIGVDLGYTNGHNPGPWPTPVP